jgi:rRNA maturation protein Rpf1
MDHHIHILLLDLLLLKDLLMYICRHHVFVKTGKKEVQLAEVGPRFEMKRMSFSASSL